MLKTKLWYFGLGYSFVMCKFSQLACSQMFQSVESAGFTFWHFWEWSVCLSPATSCHLAVPRNVGGLYGLIKVYSVKMSKLALVMSGHLNYSLLVLSSLSQDCEWRNSILSRQCWEWQLLLPWAGLCALIMFQRPNSSSIHYGSEENWAQNPILFLLLCKVVQCSVSEAFPFTEVLPSLKDPLIPGISLEA